MSLQPNEENSEDFVPAFDQAQVAVVPGAGVVARYPGILAIFRNSGHDDDAENLERLLGICAATSSSGSRAPGRRLARQLGLWLGGLDEQPSLGTISATDGGLAILLSGAASVHFPDQDATLSGSEAAAWLDRIVDWPGGPFVLTVDSQDVPLSASVFDLRAGVVPASAAVIVPAIHPQTPDAGVPEVPGAGMIDLTKPESGAVAPEPTWQPEPEEPEPEEPEPQAADLAGPGPDTAPVEPEAVPVEPEAVTMEPAAMEPVPMEASMEASMEEASMEASSMDASSMEAASMADAPTESTPAVAAEPEPEPVEVPDLPAPERFARIFGADVALPPRPPLPLHPEPGVDPAGPPSSMEPPQVHGFLCSRGHLNDPRALFCGLCGIRMAERTGVLTIGRRPPLGLLVFDDGVTFTVDAGYLLGRDPESDNRVRDGLLRPLMLIDRRGSISRRHAEITLDGWNVLLSDVGSANGTFVSPRGSEAWSALIPQRPIALLAGTRIRMGGRSMVFETPHGGA